MVPKLFALTLAIVVDAGAPGHVGGLDLSSPHGRGIAVGRLDPPGSQPSNEAALTLSGARAGPAQQEWTGENGLASRRGDALFALLSTQWLTQGSPDEDGNADHSGNKTFTTPGASQAVANTLLRSMRLEQRKRDLCRELGCIVIVNETSAYKVRSFLIEEQVGGKVRWSRNQFGAPLLAKRATYRFKMPGRDCERPAKFVLEPLAGRERVEVEGRINFCPTPGIHSLVRLNVYHPRVIVE